MAEIQITLILERDRIFTALEQQELYSQLESKFDAHSIILIQEKKGGK